jgi:hypothetical protein
MAISRLARFLVSFSIRPFDLDGEALDVHFLDLKSMLFQRSVHNSLNHALVVAANIWNRSLARSAADALGRLDGLTPHATDVFLRPSFAIQAGREDRRELNVGARVGRRDDGTRAPRSAADVHDDVVDGVVAVEVVVKEQVTGLEVIQRHVDQGRVLRFGSARNLDARLAPSPLDQAGTVETDARCLAAPDIVHANLGFSRLHGREALCGAADVDEGDRLGGLLDGFGH